MNEDRRKLKARALLDSRASISLITQQLALQLRLKKHRIITTLSEVQDITAGISKYSTSFLVTTISSPNEDLHAIACSNRTKGFDRPSHTDHKEALPWNFLHDITLEDSNFALPGRCSFRTFSIASSRQEFLEEKKTHLLPSTQFSAGP